MVDAVRSCCRDSIAEDLAADEGMETAAAAQAQRGCRYSEGPDIDCCALHHEGQAWGALVRRFQVAGTVQADSLHRLLSTMASLDEPVEARTDTAAVVVAHMDQGCPLQQETVLAAWQVHHAEKAAQIAVVAVALVPVLLPGCLIGLGLVVAAERPGI